MKFVDDDDDDDCAEADLGMFSMFGRTGAPTKKEAPQKHKKSHVCNMVTSQKY